jgi:fumarate reductase subunit C
MQGLFDFLVYVTMKKSSIFVMCFVICLFLTACAFATVGMSSKELISTEGNPGQKWVGLDGVECWRYGARHMILKNGKIIKIVQRSRNFNNLVIGLPEEAVMSLEGQPRGVSETKHEKYLFYKIRVAKFRSAIFYVRIVNGAVESYGRNEDLKKTL